MRIGVTGGSGFIGATSFAAWRVLGTHSAAGTGPPAIELGWKTFPNLSSGLLATWAIHWLQRISSRPATPSCTRLYGDQAQASGVPKAI